MFFSLKRLKNIVWFLLDCKAIYENVDVHSMSFKCYGRQMDVETTLCISYLVWFVYKKLFWRPFNVKQRCEYSILELFERNTNAIYGLQWEMRQ